MSGTMFDRVLALCDGKLTQQEVADAVGCSYPYVTMVLQRNKARGGPQRSVRSTGRGPKSAFRRDTSREVPSIRRMVLVDGTTFRAIRDRAELVHLTFDEIAGQLLAGAIAAGDLNLHFPIKDSA